MITVYGKSGCRACAQTCTELNNLGVLFNYVDINNNLDALIYLRTLGHNDLPVVVTDTTSWGGYNKDAIVRLKG